MLNENEVYWVKDWTGTTRTIAPGFCKMMIWLPIPNRLDNEGYIELVCHQNGPAHFGVWIAVLQVASGVIRAAR
jgi:hypothetical protein